jgi:methylenetetrahydrofolate reductase (NADPH)
MLIMQSQKKHTPIFSFELFPPKTQEGMKKLKVTINELNKLNPAYFSVTYGAGGSTQDRTFATVEHLRESGINTAPHLSCIGSHRDEIMQILNHYRDQGINRIVALRGDMPSGMGGEPGDFRYANELVEFIRQETGDHFYLEVAAYPEIHPQATTAQSDLDNFQRKVEAGANSAITQYFYNADAYCRFIEDCEKRGIEIPIVPGIMPINNFIQLARFSDSSGTEIPRWLRQRLEGFGDDIDSIRSYGMDVVTRLCEQLLEAGAPGLHFYTMNQVGPSRQLWENLGINKLRKL